MIKQPRNVARVIGHRQISIQQAPTNLSASPPTYRPTISAISENVDELPSLQSSNSQFSSETPVFQTIGQAQSTLSLTLPPSLPIYLKRGSLISLYTTPAPPVNVPGTAPSSTSSNASVGSAPTISSTLQITSPFTRLFHGGITSAYQRLVSTVPTNLLISAYTSTTSSNIISYFTRATESSKTFCNITLDGTTDWALLQPRALHFYAGSNLVLKTNKLPLKVNRKGVSKFGLPKNASTGLRTGWWNSGYSVCSGRGLVGLVGNGSIFQFGLQEDEYVLIKRSNLLGCSLLDKSELESGYFTAERLNSGLTATKEVHEEEDEDNMEFMASKEEEPHSDTISSRVYATVKGWYSWLKGVKDDTYEQLIVGNGDFVNVKGPRTLLLQTNTGFDHFVVNRGKGGLRSSSLESVEKYIRDKKQFKNPEKTSEDYLSYVTVKDGKVEFRNTPDFRKTVEYIESLKPKKD
ncbi:hypothetical protein CANARDRAFT_27683 [[Candida] arabinofermentans NRRL YB-2248]|uniref:Altered inheritance of mitochondria protein 24, mitochondrial n=1 Tax=[Candida] arabinofermentans NRRL YB-2248 TaxID=983967 RepID=A0A1E4T423_9ASCO|nr:hypothetical protein CANARDRAFT_27683 [[Candida] arabinofermentans NRRL YB-2248]